MNKMLLESIQLVKKRYITQELIFKSYWFIEMF